MTVKSRVFAGCTRHQGFNYHCHECAMKALGELANEIERLEALIERSTDASPDGGGG